MKNPSAWSQTVRQAWKICLTSREPLDVSRWLTIYDPIYRPCSIWTVGIPVDCNNLRQNIKRAPSKVDANKHQHMCVCKAPCILTRYIWSFSWERNTCPSLQESKEQLRGTPNNLESPWLSVKCPLNPMTVMMQWNFATKGAQYHFQVSPGHSDEQKLITSPLLEIACWNHSVELNSKGAPWHG